VKRDVSHKMVLSKHFTWKNLWCYCEQLQKTGSKSLTGCVVLCHMLMIL